MKAKAHHSKSPKVERIVDFAHRLLGGSCVVISGAISPLIWVISIVTLFITLLVATYEPPSRP